MCFFSTLLLSKKVRHWYTLKNLFHWLPLDRGIYLQQKKILQLTFPKERVTM